MSRLHRRLHGVDLALFGAVARWESPLLDPVLPPLTRAADRGALWFGASALLGARRGRTRRAAVRGLLSLALASTATNTVLKAAARRRRPAIEVVLATRRLPTQPRTSSFPSGHSASAAAYTVGAALELGWIGAPLIGLGALVALSRVYTGVHYPGDVTAGVAVGTMAALATLRAWPVHPERPASVHTDVALRPRPTGAGVTVVVNRDSGPDDGGVLDGLRESLPDARVVALPDAQDLAEALAGAAAGADVLGIAGGDGSVGCAVEMAVDRGLPLVVIPAGTYNHFARDLGLVSVDDAVGALAAGAAGDVDAGRVGGRAFVNIVSIGGYPEMVALRDRLTPHLGTLPALVVSAVRVLWSAQPHELLVDGRRRRVWLLFCGNCRYHPPGLAPIWRERLDDGLFDVRLVSAERRLGRLRFVLALMVGGLRHSRVYEAWTASELDVRAVDRPFRYARDGETSDADVGELRITKAGRVRVFRPAGAS